jgi:hypothetical protein
LTALITGGRKTTSTSQNLPQTKSDGVSADQALLHDALALLTQLDLDSTKMEETLNDASGIATLVLLTEIINSLVTFVVARTSDLDALPSRVLCRLGATNPHAEVVTEVDEQVSVQMVADVLRSWQGGQESQRQFFAGVCGALVEVLGIYGRTLGTFFRSTDERQHWRATFDVFVEGLTTALAIAPREEGTAA